MMIKNTNLIALIGNIKLHTNYHLQTRPKLPSCGIYTPEKFALIKNSRLHGQAG